MGENLQRRAVELSEGLGAQPLADVSADQRPQLLRLLDLTPELLSLQLPPRDLLALGQREGSLSLEVAESRAARTHVWC